MEYKKWECIVCGWIYDEEKGNPEEGIEPGTRWEDVPDDWVCPECGVGKEDFDMMEIRAYFHHQKISQKTFYLVWPPVF